MLVQGNRPLVLDKAIMADPLAQPNPRLRLLPPDRERLAQACARAFTRVGLPGAPSAQWAQAMPPAGQARGTLRARARERETRGIGPAPHQPRTVRCVLKKRAEAAARVSGTLYYSIAALELNEQSGSADD